MKSQTQILEREFNKGRKHTVFSATLKLGITALHQRCGELRKRGYPIAREEIYRRGRWIAQYSKVSTSGKSRSGTRLAAV